MISESLRAHGSALDVSLADLSGGEDQSRNLDGGSFSQIPAHLIDAGAHSCGA